MKSKRFFVVGIVTLCLFLFGCESQTNSTIVTTTPEPSVVIPAFTASSVVITTSERPLWLYSYVLEDVVYYVLPNHTIARAYVASPNKMEVLITQEQLETILDYGISRLEIWHMEVIGDLLIFEDSGISNAAYNLKTGDVFRLLENFTSMAIWKDMIYYVEHSTRSFTLYRKPLNQPDAEPELVLGKGSTWGRGEWESVPEDTPAIRSVYVEDGRLFFTQNNDELWEFKEGGKHVRIE